MVVGSSNFLGLHHGTQKHRVNSFRFGVALRLVKSNDNKRAIELFVFRNPCFIVEMKPCGEKDAVASPRIS